MRPPALATLLAALLPVACAPQASESPAASWPAESWPVSTPEAEGIRASALDSIDADIRAGRYGLMDHFLVIRHGRLVYDRRYEHDYVAVNEGRDTTDAIYNYDSPAWHPWYRGTDLHTLQSVTKSVTSLAMGIALDEGLIDSVGVPAMEYFEAYGPDMSDPRRARMTLQDLLTMRSGIDWNEMISYSDAENSAILLEASDDWIQYVIDRPMREEPGTRFDYNSGVSMLLGKIVREATGERIDAWATAKLFGPIGIRDFYWKITPRGEADTEGGLYLAPHDLARIAYLVLRNGEWNGQRVVSADWIRESTWPTVPDIRPDDDASVPNRGYGYQWWIPIMDDGRPVVVAGSGYGGQFPYIVPGKDLVVVFNAWNIHDAPELSAQRALQHIMAASR